MATPGIILFTLSALVCPMIPARPPKKAMITSKKEGFVRARISVLGSLMGERRK